MNLPQVGFNTINGKGVFRIFTEADRPTKRLVIMSHGFRGSTIGPARAFVDFEKLLLMEGFSVLRFDQPNSGNSDGDFIESSFNEWINTIVFFAKRYLDLGYDVSLLGQSMGATATVAASADKILSGKISSLLLWVPDPKSTVEVDPQKIYEEEGYEYYGMFWKEARDADFFGCLENFNGHIHLVYGEHDRYIEQSLRDKVVNKIKEKGQKTMILKGQSHSSWKIELTQNVFQEELILLKDSMK